MKYSAAALALAAGASAHTVMSEIYIDGKGQGSGTCVRAPKQAKGAVDPVIDLQSSDMACGKDGTSGVARTCPMSGGQELTFEYRQWPDDYSKGPLDMGHMGPCSVYLKKVSDATTDGATGDGWFKLWDEGYDESSGKWCTQKMIGNAGRITVTIPDALAGGDYLVRPELLALHNIAVKNQPEYYIGCAQVFLQSSGSSGPESTVSIPGYTSMSDPGNQYNAFDKPLKPFTIPGPKVYTPTTNNKYFTKSNKKVQTDGKMKDGCVVTNNNWCAVELPSYSDEDGCWDADKNCWDQLDVCYDTAGSTGMEGCKIWEQRCYDNQGNCKSGNAGPPNKGKNLNPPANTISVPAAVNAGMSYGSSGSGSSDSNSNNEEVPSSSTAAPTSSVAPASSPASSPDSYEQPAVKAAPAPSQEQNNNQEAAAAPQPTSAPAYQPAAEKGQATTTMTTSTQDEQGNDVEVVTEIVYETVNVYTTVTDQAEATPAAYKHKRHNHARRERHY